MRFPVVLHSDDGVRYGVTVPDLPGCFSAGDTFDDALASVVEAIDLHLEGVTEDGGDIPVPRHWRTPHQSRLCRWRVGGGGCRCVALRWAGRENQYHRAAQPAGQDRLLRQSHGATRSGFLADAARLAMRD
jgi:predicted RNase H-like HicB family nuclease